MDKDTQQPVDPLIGSVLGDRFRVIRLIDRGGMGRVYEGVQEPLGRSVAIKTLDMADPHGEFKERFFTEAKVCSRLTHPNTVRIYDYGSTDDGVYYYAMELLDGTTLRETLRATGPLKPLRAVRILKQVCGAVGEAHEAGIVHRDLKPSNVFLCHHGDQKDFAKVLDFGLVKDLSIETSLSRRDVVIGSPMYMAPEQVENVPVDKRADVYALGLLLWTALTARVPFKGSNPHALLLKQISQQPPSFDEVLGPNHKVPGYLSRLIELAIMKSRDQRIGSATDLRRGLERVELALMGDIAEPWFHLKDGRLVMARNTKKKGGAHAAVTQPYAKRPADTHISDPPTETSRSRAALAGAGFVALVGVWGILALILIGGLWWALQPEAPSPVVQTLASDPVEKDAEMRQSTDVFLTSQPTGLTIISEGSEIGKTPFKIEIIDRRPQTLELVHPSGSRQGVTIDGSQEVVEVVLTVPSRRTPAPRDLPRTEPADRPAPSGFDQEVRDPWAD
jgi:hypothetical protein